MVRVSRDIVFDESASWYEADSAPSEPTKEELDVNSDDYIHPSPIPNEGPSSTNLSGPQEPPSNESTSQSWAGSDKGKGKMSEYEVDCQHRPPR